MPTTLTIPFLTVHLHFHNNGFLTFPLKDATALRLEESSFRLAGKYAEQFQKLKINESDYFSLVREADYGAYNASKLSVAYKAAEDGISFPAFSLEFEYFYKETAQGIFAVIPAIGEEVVSDNVNHLERRIEEVIRLNFTRHKRLKSVQDIVATIWFDQTELIKDEIMIKTYSLTEQDEMDGSEEVNWLERVGTVLDLTDQEVWFREKEMEQLSRAVKNDFNRNVILVGKSGVGKSAMIWELARLRKLEQLAGKIWETNASRMIRELMDKMGWEENMGLLMRSLEISDDFLYIKNLLELFEVGQSAGNETSMADVLNSYLGLGNISVLSECTSEELSIIEARSPGFLSHFQIIRIEEPTTHLQKMIVRRIEDIANSQELTLERSAIEESIRLNRRFAPYSGMPGRPIRFLESLLMNHQIDKNKNNKVSNKEILRSFSEESGLPMFMIDEDIAFPVKEIKANFNNQVAGQEKAVDTVVNMLATVKTAVSRSGKPIASYLFVGPTGVGKTEMAKVLSEFMFGNRDRLIRFDMSEYNHPGAVSRLIGSSYFEDGLLTSAVRREPFSVLLFDEIEKADRSFYDLLLQVLDEGRLTDSQGKTVNFCSAIIIMTSNIGAANLQDNRISWKSTLDTEEVESHFESAVQKHFRPEFYNRIDRIIPFGPLSQPVIEKIVEREIRLLKNREGIKFRNLNVNLDESVYDFLSVKGYDSQFGARYLQRTIREQLIIPLSRKINAYDFEDQVNVLASSDGKAVTMEVTSDELALELWMEELNKIQDADTASHYRREVQSLERGSTYVSVMSKLAMLEADKKRLKEKFWKDDTRVKDYTRFLDFQKNMDQLKMVIEELELSLSLIKMGLKTNETRYREALKIWNKKLWDFKVKLFLYLEPSGNAGIMGLYGMNLQPIIDFYLEVFKRKRFEYTASGIWYREEYFKRLIPDPNSPTGELIEAKEYIIEPIELNAYPNVKPENPKSGDILCGVAFNLSEGLPAVFFNAERGFHKYVLANNMEHKYFVDISNTDKLKPPPEIYRQNFYKKPRRIVEEFAIQDTDWSLKREVNKGGHLDIVIEELENRLVDAVNRAVF